MSARERFEKWAELRWHPDAKGSLEQDASGGYYNTAVEYAWRAWQAAKADDAEICDARADRLDAHAENIKTRVEAKHVQYFHDAAIESRECAAAIRASDAIGGR